MAWSTPRTFVAGEMVFRAMLDAQIRDNELYLKGDAAWTPVAFQNGWVNFGGVYQVCQYRRIGDLVFLRGIAKSGTMAAAMFTLPVGYRPWPQQTVVVISNNAFGRLTITNSGIVTPNIGSNVSVSLAGIVFKAP